MCSMMRFTVAIILMLVVGTPGYANSLEDTVATDTVKQKNKWRMIFSFDTRRSFIVSRNATIFGLKPGVELNKKHRFGIGLYSLSNPIILDDVRTPEFDTAAIRLEFGYGSIYYEYVLLNNKRWEFTVPFHLGGGTVKLSHRDSLGQFIPWREQGVMATELSVTGYYKVLRWFAVGGGVGYRAMVTRDEQTKRAFNAPIYIIKARLLVGEIYKMIFKKDKIDE